MTPDRRAVGAKWGTVALGVMMSTFAFHNANSRK
jgi:hypothetical protein